LHTVLVLVLQGVSILIIWRQAVEAIGFLESDVDFVLGQNYDSPEEFAGALNYTAYSNVFDWVPKGVDATKEKESVNEALYAIVEGLYNSNNGTNQTAVNQIDNATNELFSATFKTLFDSLSVSVPKTKKKAGDTAKSADFEALVDSYYNIFHLVVYYVFISVSSTIPTFLITVVGPEN
jgi:hypothetical protein